MKLRYKFFLAFSCLFLFSLSVSLVIVYRWYDNYRKRDFFERLETDAQTFYKLYNSIDSISSYQGVSLFATFATTHFFQQKQAILDIYGNDVLKIPSNANIKISSQEIKLAIKQGTYISSTSRSQKILIYDKEKQKIVYVSAYDLIGNQKTNKLRNILVIVCIVSSLILLAVTYSFVESLLKPLTNLNKQIQNINVNQLDNRIDVDHKVLEIAEIGNNFNSVLQKLEQSVSQQKLFIQRASHELRTPLSVMYSETEAALSKDLNEESAKEVLNSLREEELAMINLTNALLFISQAESTKITHADFDSILRIDEIILHCCAILKKQFPLSEFNVNFLKVPDTEVEVSFKGNEALMQSLFINLFKNAYQYSKSNQIQIDLSFDEQDIIIFITNDADDPQKNLTELSQHFVRGANSNNTKGFGLGLSIVSRIVHLYKGSIQYQYTPNKTIVFTIRLPKNIF